MAGIINWKKATIPSGNPDSDHLYVGIDIADGAFYIKNSTGAVSKYETTTNVAAAIALALQDYDLSTVVDTKISTAINNLINGAGSTLDTLNELAAALGNDPNFAATTASALANRLRVDTAAQGLNSTQKTNAKTNIDLQNVDNTSDLNKPISTATQTALNGKENTVTAGTTGQYYRGDKTFQTLDKTAVGLSNVDNTSDANKPISTATQTALNLKYDASNPNGYETPSQLNARDTANRARSNHTGTQTSSTISDFANTVRSTVLTGLSTATAQAIAATDTILQAFGYLQAQLTSLSTSVATNLGLKADKSTTISAGTSLNGGGDLSTNRTINHNTFGTAGTYGSASTVPVITIETTGHIAGVTATAIAIVSTAVTDFATAVRSVVLTGYTVGTNTAIAATDTILQAFGKIQGQINQINANAAAWNELITTADIITGSNVTLSNVAELGFTATVGKTYYLEYTIKFRAAATTTGITLTIGTTNGAAGSLACQVNMPVAADGTAALFTGSITTLGDVVVGTGTPTIQPDWYIANIKGSFICTTAGLILPQFRSEVNLSNVNFGTGSIALIREF
jgi:hypothetical protein